MSVDAASVVWFVTLGADRIWKVVERNWLELDPRFQLDSAQPGLGPFELEQAREVVQALTDLMDSDSDDPRDHFLLFDRLSPDRLKMIKGQDNIKLFPEPQVFGPFTGDEGDRIQDYLSSQLSG